MNSNNTLFSPSLSSHTKGYNNNHTTQYSHNSMNLSVTSGVKRNNGYCSSTSKHNTNACYAEVNLSTLNRKLFPLRDIGTTLIRRVYITTLEVILAMGIK